MNWRSITLRLVALYCGLLLVLGLSFSLFTVYSFERYTEVSTRSAISARAPLIWEIIRGSIGRPAEVRALIERFSPAEQNRFFLVNVDGRTAYRSGNPADGSFDPANLPFLDASSGPRYSNDGAVFLYSQRFTTPAGLAVTIETGQSDLFAKDLEDSLVTSLVIGLPLLLLAAAAASYVLIRRALSPVEVMIQAAEAISFRNPRNRLPLLGTGDRVEALGLALNRMLDRLDSAYQHANRFSSDAAHELRTPLAIIQGELEFAMARGGIAPDVESALSNVLDEAGRLSKIVDSLLMLSRMDHPSGQRGHASLDLHALAAETIDQMHLLAAEKGVTLKGPTGGKITVSGDRDRLKQVIVNLLDNGIKYNVAGGHVVVDVSAGPGLARLTVSDCGIGIAPENLDYVFDRFYRVSTNRGEVGAGLGLAIVKSICHAHGGSISVTSKVGVGTTFCVTLPSAARDVGSPPEFVLEQRGREVEPAG
ncbi:MAG TPA: ATP-binding protein [Micropepsaceae bacterium]|nr:ATP-binding protein [Micropepsaceae bacterium]